MIKLETFNQNYYDKLISWIDSKEILMQFAGPAYTFPLDYEQLNKSLSDKNRFAFRVVNANTKSTIGHGEIYLTEKSAYLGRIIIGEKQFRGKGIGQIIVNQLLNYAFNRLNQVRVELNVFDWNVSAIKCYEKVGFVVDQNKKAERKINEQTWTVLNMVIDKAKWKQGQDILKDFF